jgi:hypothetical protein
VLEKTTGMRTIPAQANLPEDAKRIAKKELKQGRRESGVWGHQKWLVKPQTCK